MELEIKDYFKIVARRWWIIAITMLLCSAPVYAYEKYMAKPIYEADTKLIVTSASGSTGQTKLDENEINSNIMIINTYKEVIKSPAIMDIVIRDHPDIHLSDEQLIGNIKVSASDYSQVMNISIRDSSQAQAVEIVNAVADVFKKEIPKIMKVDNVTVLSAAKLEANPTPVSSNEMLKLVMAAFVGFVIAIGIIFLRENMDDTIKSEEDVRIHLGQPTLATIAKAKSLEWKSAAKSAKGKVGIESVQQN